MIREIKNISSVLALIIVWGAIAEEIVEIPKAKTWGLKFPEATASLGACVVNDHLYVHGGHVGATHVYSEETHSKNFLRVNLGKKNAKWEKLPVHVPVQGFGMVAYKGRIYRIGGSQATNSKDEPSNLRSLASCSVFDVKKKKWSETTPLPAPRSSHDAAVSPDGKIYVTGGWDMGNGKPREEQWYKHALVADLNQTPIVWKKLPEADWVVRAHATEVYKEKLYVAGGIGAKGTLNTINVLDLKSNKWEAGLEYPGQGRMKGFGMALCVWNDRLYANSYSSTVRYLNQKGDGWEDASIRLSNRRFFHRMVPVSHDRLLFVAGANFENHLGDIEEYRASQRPGTKGETLKTTGHSWPSFRGDGASRSPAKHLPVEWSDKKNIRWNVKLPGYGQSSPVVWNGRVFTTSTEGDNSEKVSVRCTSLLDGKELWSRSFSSSSPIERSKMVSQAAPSPVVDSKGVYVFFESGDLLALNHEGTELWRKNLGNEYGPLTGHHGLGSSLFQSDTCLGLLLDHPDPSYLLCFDKLNGKAVWSVKREKRVSWATPTLVGDSLFISSNGLLEEFDFTTGKQLWFVGDLTGNTVASATVSGDLVIVGSSAKGNCIAVRRGGSGDVTETHVAWKAQEATSSFGSPLIHEGHVYFVSRAGILSCLDLKTGEQKWDRRLGASCWASPLAAAGNIYFFDKAGKTLVIKSGGSQTVVAQNDLSIDGTVYGVAALEEVFVLRTGTQLICINTVGKKTSYE